MLRRGTIVRVVVPGGRKARRAVVKTGILISDPYGQGAGFVCAVGFFSTIYGPWVEVLPVAAVVEEDGPCETIEAEAVPRSYRPEYRIWKSMCARCSKPRHAGYYLYGGRTKVCASWEGSFERFLADVGLRPSPRHSLDRINNDGDYEPGNVRWATPKEQARNTSTVRKITAFGKTKAITEWAEELGISAQSVKYRLATGWTPEDAVSKPKSRLPHFSGTTKHRRGSDHHLSKLDEVKVATIRAAIKSGESIRALAKAHGVAVNTIVAIYRGQTWKHVTEEAMCEYTH